MVWSETNNVNTLGRAVGNGCGGPGSALSGTATFGWGEFPGHDIGRRIS